MTAPVPLVFKGERREHTGSLPSFWGNVPLYCYPHYTVAHYTVANYIVAHSCVSVCTAAPVFKALLRHRSR